MKNKLRSVIEREANFFEDIKSGINTQEAYIYAFRIMDVLIEEMERSKLIHNSILHTHSVCPIDYHDGCIDELNRQINILKQAREEIFTSTAQ